MQTEIIFSDVHAPYHDPRAWRLFLKIARDVKPDILHSLGDFVDCKPISRFLKPAREITSLQREFNVAHDLLAELRDEHPRAEIAFQEGNHEFRFWDYLHSRAPEVAELDSNTIEEQLDLASLKIKVVGGGENRELFKRGKLWHMHGHETRVSIGAVNPAASVEVKAQGNVVAGHWHRFDHRLRRTIRGETHGVWINGCLCTMSVPYDSMPNWVHGITIVSYAASGFFHVEQVPFFDGYRAMVGGKLYLG